MPKDEETKKKKMVVVEEVVEPPAEVESPKEEVNADPEMNSGLIDESEKTNYLWIIVPTALLVGAFAGGLITYFSGLSRLDSDAPTPTPIATELPKIEEKTKTEEKDELVDRSAIKLQVLNGSGIAGFAGKAKTMLEGLGYKDVAVGNASNSNFTETIISVKASKKELLKFVVEDLSKDYDVSSKTETLLASSPYDFVITLGNK